MSGEYLSVYNQGKYDEALELLKNNFDKFHNDIISSQLGELASQGRNDFIQVFLDNGIDVDLVNYCNETPLLRAILSAEVETVKFLLDNGADVNKPGNLYLRMKGGGCHQLVTNRTPIEACEAVITKIWNSDYHNENKRQVLNLLIDYGAELSEGTSDNIKTILQQRKIKELENRIKELEDENEELRLRPPIKGGDLYQYIERDFYKELKNIDL